jgi:hypothetical protein
MEKLPILVRMIRRGWISIRVNIPNQSKNMNRLKNLFLAGMALAVFIPNSHAQPWFKTGSPIERIHKKEQVDKIEPGSQLVLVCKGSDTVTLINIKDKKQAQELCASGHMVHCKDCRKTFKVVWTNPTGKGQQSKTTMQIVNSKGEPCMFLARIK